MIIKVNNFNDCKIIIEKAFYDYNNIIHSTLNYYSPLQFLDNWNNGIILIKISRGFLKKWKGGCI
ncbi:hypothetical protein AOG54_06760 [Acidiplasma aeolicum]|uniref:Uncharacterized protein n=1 Tax=Acidiplasma aeolicum TaxID=507754 RepID=A0A0Q0WE95_9ARCH|nr:hypothetical protein AOG54_06760 [Acidiplasma aeolicum]